MDVTIAIATKILELDQTITNKNSNLNFVPYEAPFTRMAKC